MDLRCRCGRVIQAQVGRFLLGMLIAFLLEPALAAKTATISGLIFTVGSDQAQVVWPNARVTLKSLDTNNEIDTISNDTGRYAFTGILYGSYEITVTLAGFEPITKRVTIETDHPPQLDFQLVPKGQSETITV